MKYSVLLLAVAVALIIVITPVYALTIPPGVSCWTQVAAKLGSETGIASLTTYDDGTGLAVFGGASLSGRLFKYNASFGNWTMAAAKLGVETYIPSLTTYDDGTGLAVFGGTGINGYLYKYNASLANWTQVADTLGAETNIGSLTTYDDGTGLAVFGGTAPNGKLYKYNASLANWTQVAAKLGSESNILSLTTYDDGTGLAVFGGTYAGGRLYKYNASLANWTQVAARLGTEGYIYSLTTYNDGTGLAVFGGTRINGSLYKYNASLANWTRVAAKLGAETYILSLTTYDDGTGLAVFGGTYPNGKLYKYNLTLANWTQVADTLGAETTIYSLTTYDDGTGLAVFGGTAPNGKLYKYTYQLIGNLYFAPTPQYQPLYIKTNYTMYASNITANISHVTFNITYPTRDVKVENVFFNGSSQIDTLSATYNNTNAIGWCLVNVSNTSQLMSFSGATKYPLADIQFNWTNITLTPVEANISITNGAVWVGNKSFPMEGGSHLFDKVTNGSINVSPYAPLARFTSNVTTGLNTSDVWFNDTSLGYPSASAWNWSFQNVTGNNTEVWFSQTQNVTYTFGIGNWLIRLNASNAYGYNITPGSYFINITAPTIAEFSGTPRTGTTPLSVSFTDLSTGGTPSGWAWFFGDEPYTQPWTQINASSGYPIRYYTASVVLPDSSIVMIGGYTGSLVLNDTWRSTDQGVTWTRINASSGWAARYVHTAVTMPDGNIVITGGLISGSISKNDTWRSTDKGVTWSQINASPGWLARYGHSTVVQSDGSIVLMGGYNGVIYKNDVWKSTDQGATWTQINASAGWTARYLHNSVIMPDGSIVLMGGAGSATYFNDTWRSTDGGFTWTRINASGGWVARRSFSAVEVPDSSIVLFGGYVGIGSVYLNDTWRSTDQGATWTRINASSGWLARLGQTSVAATDGSIVLMGGYNGVYLNDTWRFNPVGSNLQNPTHLYTSVGNYTVSLTAAGALNYNTTIKTGYINVSAAAVAAPTANFTSNVTSGTAPTPVQFNDTSNNTPTGWNWSFRNVTGNNTEVWFSQSQNPVYTLGLGNWSIKLTANNTVGSNTTPGTYFINVSGAAAGAAPTANFTSNVISGTAPTPVQFNDTSNNTPTSWNWSFKNVTGNNTEVWFSQSQNPAYTFGLGNWSIKLNASNAYGYNITPGTYFINVSAAPILVVANFSGTPRSGNTSLNVSFTDLSTGSPTSWTWYFGDESYANPWVQKTGAAGWAARYDHTSVVLPDNSIVLMGGQKYTGTWIALNDVWRSTNEGATWTQVNASAGWAARYGHTSVALPDGSIVLTGGVNMIGGVYNDVWRSTNNGSTWTQVNASAGWAARFKHTNIVLPDGSIVLTGGRNAGGSVYNDVWRSTDQGATWAQVNASAGWTVRFGHTSVVLPDGSIVLMGGNIWASNKNDVWRSTDQGTTWTQINASAGWVARNSHTSVAMPDGSIVLMGGQTAGSAVKNDVWRSIDSGVTWTQVNASAGWAARSDHTSIVLLNGSIVLMGGLDGGYRNDVWELSTASSIAQNPSHVYTLGGNYTVTLVANTTTSTNTSIKIFYINVSSAPVASFTSNATSGYPPRAIQFNDTSGYLPTSWNWSFQNVTGNNTAVWFSQSQNPVYTFGVGNWLIRLTANNTYGANTTPGSYFVNISASALITNFTSNVTSGTDPTPVQFNETSTGTYTPTAWNWSFRNVTGNNTEVWFSQSQNPVYTFGVGNWSIKLNASTIYEANTTPFTYFINISPAIVAGFTSNVTTGLPPATINFTDTTTGFPEAWNWSFQNVTGNNTEVWFSQSQNPIYTFGVGNWSIKLTANNTIGSNTTPGTHFINISEGATIARFTSNKTAGVTPTAILFSDTSLGTPMSWNWSFGDGSLSTAQNPVKTYSTSGIYTVTLNASNSYGDNITIKTDYITIYNQTKSGFTANKTDGMAPLPVKFTVTDPNDYANQWRWDFGDGDWTYGGIQNATHVYSSPGLFTVSETALNTIPDIYPNWTIAAYQAGGIENEIKALTTYDDGSGLAIFGGSSYSGQLYKYNRTLGNWSLVAAQPVDAYGIYALVTYNDGTGDAIYGSTGSGTGGELYKYNTTTGGWLKVAYALYDPDFITDVYALRTYNDGSGLAIFGTGSQNASLVKYNATLANWSIVAVQPDDGGNWAGTSLIVYNDGTGQALFAGEKSAGELYKYNTSMGGKWSRVANTAGGTQSEIQSLVTYDDGSGMAIFGGTAYDSQLYKYNLSLGDWSLVAGTISGERQITSLTTYNDGTGLAIFGGTGDLGQLHKYNASLAAWELVAQPPDDYYEAVIYSLVEYNDGTGLAIYGGTGYNYAALYKYGSVLQIENTSTIYNYINVSPEAAPPTASFTSNVTSGVTAAAVQFNDTSGYLPDSWNWSFRNVVGNNTEVWFSQSQNPVYTFGVGNWSIKLTANNTLGSNTTPGTYYINVSEWVVTASFTSNITSGIAPPLAAIQFNDTSTGYPTSWNWSFGDGSLSTSQNPVKVYSTGGKYTVALNATNGTANSITIKTGYITILNKTISGFVANVTNGVLPLPVGFTVTSPNDNATTWNWSFGDGAYTYGNTQNSTHVYLTPGTFTVSETAIGIYPNISPNWTQVAAQAGTDVSITALATYNDGTGLAVYGGSGDNFPSGAGNLYKYNKSLANWTKVANNAGGITRSIYTTTNYNDGSGDAIYGSVQPLYTSYLYQAHMYKYNASLAAWLKVADAGGAEEYFTSLTTYDDGSGLAIFGGASPNATLYKYNITLGKWSQVAAQAGGTEQAITALTTYDDGTGLAIFGGSAKSAGHSTGMLYKYNISLHNWSQVAAPAGGTTPANIFRTISAITTYNDGTGDAIYGMTWEYTSTSPPPAIYSRLYKYNASLGSWLQLATVFDNGLVNLQKYDDGTGLALYSSSGTVSGGSGFPTDLGKLYKYNASLAGFLQVAAQKDSQIVPSLIVYNDGIEEAIYGGTKASAKLFKYGSTFTTSNTTTNVNYITVNAGAPTASFTSNVTGGGAPLAVQFNDTSVGVPNPDSWNWSFRNVTGNNTEVWFSQNQNPVYTFGLGNWSIKLTANNTLGSNTTPGTYFINVSAPLPVAGFTANITVGRPPLVVQFNDTSTNSPTMWNWSIYNATWVYWSNTTVPANANITYTFTHFGSYNILLNVSNAMGSNTSTKIGYITIGEWILQNSSAGWGARDGSASTVYNNKLWLFGGFLRSAVSPQNDTWYSTDGNVWTQATAGANWEKRTQALALTYSNKMWIMGGYRTAIYNDTWRSTDGINWVQTTSSAGWGSRYGLSGVVYDNKMWIMGGYSGTGTYYNDTWYSTDGITWTRATAGANWSQRVGAQAFTFNNKMWIMGGESSTGSYYNDTWYSTDGVTWTQANSSSGWAARGALSGVVYNNKMWIMGGSDGGTYYNDVWQSSDGNIWVQGSQALWLPRSGLVSTNFNNTIWAMGGRNSTGWYNDVWYLFPTALEPTADFTSNVTSGYISLPVQFNDTSTGGTPTAWNWSIYNATWVYWSNTTTPGSQNITYLFTTAGKYNVSLTVSNNVGSNTLTRIEYITATLPSPTANFTSNITSGYITLPVQFNDTSTGMPPVIWNWSIYNATWVYWLNTTIPANANITYSFANPGTFTVKLIVTDTYGTSNTTIKVGYISAAAHSAPVADFTANVTSGAIPLAVGFTDLSILNPDAWYWEFGDGTNSTTRNPSHTYALAGTYNVNLRATNTTWGLFSWNNKTAYITATPPVTSVPGGTGLNRYVTTHVVRFMCKDWSGAPIQNMNVTSIGVQSSLGSIDWVASFFGINLNDTPILNTSQSATTDYGGSVVFLMVPTEKYRLDYVCSTLGINESRYYYPKEEWYNEIFWTTPVVYSSYVISYTLYNATNGSYMDLGVHYIDISNHTTDNLTFWVKNSTGGLIYTQTNASGHIGDINYSYPIPLTQNGIYYWGFSANTTMYEMPINLSNYFRIEGMPEPVRIDLQIGTDAPALEIYNWIAVIVIMLIAFIFGRITIKFGIVIVPIMAMFFKFIGWLQTPWLLISIAVTLGIFWYMRYAEEGE